MFLTDARRVPHTVHAGIARLASPMGRFPSAHEASPSAPILAGSGFRPRMVSTQIMKTRFRSEPAIIGCCFVAMCSGYSMPIAL